MLYQIFRSRPARWRVRGTSLTILVALVTLAGCRTASNPAAPDRVDTHFAVPDFLAPSLALIDADTRPVPMLNEPGGVWLRRVTRGVVVDAALPVTVRAQCCRADGLIRWSTGWTPDVDNPRDVRLAAAILIHEGRHGEGFRHTCPDNQRDRTFEEGGAWALHATWLRHMGDQATAESIATYDIGCR